jgi:hypothetical protein
LLFARTGSAQFQWWNDLHNWDGATPWNQYFTYSHAFLGPNALPIPQITGTHSNFATTSTQLSLRGDDQFLNWHNELQFITGKTRFHVVHQSIEAFRTTTEVRDRRASRGESGQGIQAGDVLVNITHELYRDNQDGLKIFYFTTHLKTAAGPLNNARFTDAPGYAFFFSGQYNPAGTDFWLTGEAGFQVYQTFWTEYPQNDGLLCNLRATQRLGDYGIQAGIRSFTGYFRNGDWPRILDLSIDRNHGNSRTVLGLTHGLNDYPFSFLTLSYQFFL